MNLNAKITLKIKNFFRKNKKIIITVAIVWTIIIIINQYLKNLPTNIGLKNTYTPDTAVITSDSVPTKYQAKIKQTIDDYFNYCNKQNYDQAYDLLTDDCKSYLYNNDVNIFKKAIQTIFNGEKIYNIQNYSNVGKVYIYDINILDDIGATGTTGGYTPYKEKLTMHLDSGDNFKISNNGYIENKVLNLSNEDGTMKMNIESKDLSYTREGYNVEITNKTDSYLIISDNNVSSEITLTVNGEQRTATNLTTSEVILRPGETNNFLFIFDKYYDDGNTATKLSLNDVRVIDNYIKGSTDTDTKAKDKFSFNINLN